MEAGAERGPSCGRQTRQLARLDPPSPVVLDRWEQKVDHGHGIPLPGRIGRVTHDRIIGPVHATDCHELHRPPRGPGTRDPPGRDTVARVPDQRTLTVNGTSRTAAVPDEAVVRLGVQLTRPTADAARREAASVTDAVIAALLDLGIDRADIRTETVALTAAFE